MLPLVAFGSKDGRVIVCWALAFQIIKGSLNANADALSCSPIHNSSQAVAMLQFNNLPSE